MDRASFKASSRSTEPPLGHDYMNHYGNYISAYKNFGKTQNEWWEMQGGSN